MESAVARLSYSEKAAALIHAREIVQIGAVRLLENRTVADEFQILIQPKYFKKGNGQQPDRHQGCGAARIRRSVPTSDGALSRMVRRREHFPDVGLRRHHDPEGKSGALRHGRQLGKPLVQRAADLQRTDRRRNVAARPENSTGADGHRAEPPGARRAWRRLPHGADLQPPPPRRRDRSLRAGGKGA